MADNDLQLPLGVAGFMVGLSYGQMLRLVQQRRITGERRGGHWFTSASAVRAFDREREHSAAGDVPADRGNREKAIA